MRMKNIIRVASASMVVQLLGIGSGFLLNIFIVRLLDVEDSGSYFLAVSVLMLASVVSRYGLDNTVVRFVAANKESNNWAYIISVVKTATFIVSIASILIGLLLYFFSSFIASTIFGKSNIDILIQIVGLILLPFSLSKIYAEALRGVKCIIKSQFVKSLILPLSSLVLLYPCVVYFGVEGALVSYMLAAVITSFIGFIWWMRTVPRNIPNQVFSRKRMHDSCKPLLVVTLIDVIFQTIGNLSLGLLSSASEVAIFHMANRTAAMVFIPLFAVVSVLSPRISALISDNSIIELSKISKNSSFLLTIIVLPVVVFIMYFSDDIMSFYGEDFIAGSNVLNILLVGVMFKVSTGVVSEILMMGGYEKTVRNISYFSVLFLISLCFVLVPLLGAEGAAYSFTLSVLLRGIIFLIAVKRKFGFWVLWKD